MHLIKPDDHKLMMQGVRSVNVYTLQQIYPVEFDFKKQMKVLKEFCLNNLEHLQIKDDKGDLINFNYFVNELNSVSKLLNQVKQ